jgi:hypothetical protein
VPRYEGDGVRLISNAQPRDRAELEAVSSKIRAVLE